MNSEKIRELYFQATKWCEENAVGTPVAWEFEEKFAALIVKECVSRIDLYHQRDEITEDWVYTNLENDIKEHFGVEE